MFFFPKDKTTGLDVDVNAHYVFDLSEDHLSLYPFSRGLTCKIISKVNGP